MQEECPLQPKPPSRNNLGTSVSVPKLELAAADYLHSMGTEMFYCFMDAIKYM